MFRTRETPPVTPQAGEALRCRTITTQRNAELRSDAPAAVPRSFREERESVHYTCANGVMDSVKTRFRNLLAI